LNLGYPDLKIDDKEIRKQRFRPIGIICLGCGYAVLSKHLLFTLNRKRKPDLGIAEFNDGRPLLKRQEGRRYEREDKKRDKQLEKTGIKYPSVVKVEDSY
jgi:hypothetical protein